MINFRIKIIVWKYMQINFVVVKYVLIMIEIVFCFGKFVYIDNNYYVIYFMRKFSFLSNDEEY